MNKRLFAVLLCLVMIVGLMPFGAFAATDADTAYTATDTTAAADQAAADRTYLAFTSDVHNQGNNTSANRLNTWINAVTAKVGDDIDVMGFCGDFGNASAGQSDYWNYAGSVMSACEGNSKVHDHVYTTGNHEFNPGSYDSNNSAARGKIFRLGEAKKGNDYIVYAFGAHDWNNWSDHYDTGDISELNSYLAGLGAADRAKPIFILTHFPIHSYSSRRTTNADQVLNMLNGYADQGYKIYYLWGHNHSQSDPAYDEIYTGNVRINNNSYNFHFTYAAAGCMSDQEYGSGSASVKGKGLLVGIENGNVVSMNYYNENAVDVTENSYTEPTSQPTTSPTTPVSGNQYVIVIDGHALTTSAGDSYTSNSSSSYHYSGLAGKTYTSGMTVTDDMLWTFTPSGNGYLISNNGKYLNGTYASNSAGGSDGALNLNSTQDVWVLTNDSLKSTNASNGQSSDKFLAYGNGDIRHGQLRVPQEPLRHAQPGDVDPGAHALPRGLLDRPVQMSRADERLRGIGGKVLRRPVGRKHTLQEAGNHLGHPFLGLRLDTGYEKVDAFTQKIDISLFEGKGQHVEQFPDEDGLVEPERLLHRLDPGQDHFRPREQVGTKTTGIADGIGIIADGERAAFGNQQQVPAFAQELGAIDLSQDLSLGQIQESDQRQACRRHLGDGDPSPRVHPPDEERNAGIIRFLAPMRPGLLGFHGHFGCKDTYLKDSDAFLQGTFFANDYL